MALYASLQHNRSQLSFMALALLITTKRLAQTLQLYYYSTNINIYIFCLGLLLCYNKSASTFESCGEEEINLKNI